MDVDGLQRRIAHLEEAMAECLAWIKAQDIYDDQLDEDTAWLPRLDQIRSPLGYHYDPEGLRAYLEQTFALVERCTAVIGETALERAEIRARLRQRYRLRPNGRDHADSE